MAIKQEDFLLLPSHDFEKIRLVRIPEDFERHEAFRHATGLIAEVEEDPDSTWEDILDILEDHGFSPVEFVLGPELE